MTMHFITSLMNAHWAMDPQQADSFKEVVDRMLDGTKVDFEVLEAYRSKTADRGERLRIRDNVGILYVDGPLFKRANLFTEFCGATSYETLRRDLQAALDDSSVQSIAMWVDSPGGEASGVDEVANAIYDARKKKPITAFVSGMAASGGYWLASAADNIVVSDVAMLGSIGVVLGIRDSSEAEAKRGVKNLQFVSSQSPGKRPDPNTTEGRDRIQRMVNDLADVFVTTVARNRGVDAETVISKFGAGGVEVGKKAVDLGMADKVGSFEAVLDDLKTRGKGRMSTTRFGGFSMSADNTGPSAEELAATAASNATKAAQVRMKSILTADAAKTLPALANHLAYDTTMSSEDATKILAAASTDLEAAKPKAAEGDTTTQQQQQQPAADFAAHKANSGALTAIISDGGGNDRGAEAVSIWSKAAARVNPANGVN